MASSSQAIGGGVTGGLQRGLLMAKPRLCEINTANTSSASGLGAGVSGGAVGAYVLIDVCLEETHEHTNTVTDHPVEQGSNISDHVRPDPDLVTLHCFVSNTPLSEVQQTRAVQDGSIVFQTTSAADVSIGAVDGRGQAVYSRLLSLRNQGTLVQLVTTLRTYALSATEGMVVQRLSVPRTAKNYDGLEWTMTLKRVRVVYNQQTTVVQTKDTRRKKVSTGNQTTSDGTPNNTPLYDIKSAYSSSPSGGVKALGNLLNNEQSNTGLRR